MGSNRVPKLDSRRPRVSVNPSPELEARIRSYAAAHGRSLSRAVEELVTAGLESIGGPMILRE